MSDKQTELGQAVSETQYQQFQFKQAEQFIGRLHFGGKSLDLPRREGLELMSVEPTNGIPGVVVRHRQDRLDPLSHDRSRQDVYYAFHLGRAGVEPMLSVLSDNLVEEQKLVDEGRFEDIKPHRESLAQQALLFPNNLEDVRVGEHEDIHQFVELLHAAITVQQSQANAAVA